MTFKEIHFLPYYDKLAFSLIEIIYFFLNKNCNIYIGKTFASLYFGIFGTECKVNVVLFLIRNGLL